MYDPRKAHLDTFVFYNGADTITNQSLKDFVLITSTMYNGKQIPVY